MLSTAQISIHICSFNGLFFSISAVFRVSFLRLLKNAVFSAEWMKWAAAKRTFLTVFSGLLCGPSLKFWLHYKASLMCPPSCAWSTMERGKKKGEKCQHPESINTSKTWVLFSFWMSTQNTGNMCTFPLQTELWFKHRTRFLLQHRNIMRSLLFGHEKQLHVTTATEISSRTRTPK